jgi:hypothetical protein
MHRFRLASLVALLCLSALPGRAADPVKDPQMHRQEAQRSTRSRPGAAFRRMQADEGLARYLRIGVHDGNLVTGALVNSGLLSYHYVGPANPFRIGWPKGPALVRYLHSGVFYVAAEVVDANGDTVQIVSDNYRRSNSERSLDFSHLYATMPLPGYFNLDQPDAIDAPLVGGISEDVGPDGIPGSNDEGEGDGELQPGEDFNRNGELDLSMQNAVGWFAMSHRRETWPQYWPVGTYPGDGRTSPGLGVRSGRWNGEFGALVRADQESYFAFTDRENDEFDYYPIEGDERGYPEGRRGLGLITEVRGYQWNARLAEDIFINIYDVTNEGKDLPKAVVGMYVDPDVDGGLSGDNASFDEVDDITFAWLSAGVSSRGFPIGRFGFAFLESPGLASDGVDNDLDGMVDESQNNGIDDDGDWVGWTDENGNGVWDNEDVDNDGELGPDEDVNGDGRLTIEPLNDDLGADGIGPGFDEYIGPDVGEANGVPDPGEPNFDSTDNDESDQVGLTSFFLRDVDDTMADDTEFWNTEIQPGTFFVREGFQRDVAWTYGSGFVEFAGNERTHRYAIAVLFGNDQDDIIRNKRTMQVIYDADYNFARAPRKPLVTASADDGQVFLRWDALAERARDPIYGRDFEAYQVLRSTDPSFNDIKTISDAFGNPLLFEPLAIYDVDNGLSGPHPLRIGSELGPASDLGVSYNMGTDSGLRHFYLDTDVDNGRQYYYAVVSLDQGYVADFYPEISDREGLQPISPTESGALIEVDPLGRAVSQDVNTVAVVPTEPVAGWIDPTAETYEVEHLAGVGTGTVRVEVFDPFGIKHDNTYRLEFADDGAFVVLDERFTGASAFARLENVTEGLAVAAFTDFDDSLAAAEYFGEGFRVIVDNDAVGIAETEWTTGSSPLQLVDVTEELAGLAVPRDYEIRILAAGADSSVNGSRPTNFQVFDVTDPANPFRVAFRYTDRGEPEVLDAGDRLILVNNPEERTQLWKWDFAAPDTNAIAAPVAGDVFRITTSKPFDRNDLFEFTAIGNVVDPAQARDELDDIYVVPDPYLAYNAVERRVTNEAEGRGERKIEFVNLPDACTVSIYTSAGRLVRVLEHEAGLSRRLSWDMRTKDGLEIASGVYFFVVDAEVGRHRGRFAIVK